MTKFLFEHYEGCTPLKPCANCQTVSWLRAKLKSHDFEELLKRAQGHLEPNSSGKLASLDSSVEVLRPLVPSRVMIALQSENLQTIGELIKKTEAEMFRIPNLGRRSLHGLTEALASLGHRLADST